VHSEDTNTHTWFAVLEPLMISAFSGFGEYLLDRHSYFALHLL
jgi:hypothetical protein